MASASADSPGEQRFFADCPQRGWVHLHHEQNPWDLHAILYTAVGLGEVELVRVADALIDLPLPGPSLHPLRRTILGVRSAYHRLPPWTVRRRVGEFMDAWQLPELSLADASATYSAATGGEAGLGSGLVVRAQKLVDWLQHVTGDVNWLSGRLVGRRRGLVTWSLPERAVDGLQGVILKTFHHTMLWITRSADAGLEGVELAGEGVINIGYRRPHRQDTVFLRLPLAVYRAHELWMLEHRPRLVIGRADTFAGTTHAELAHRFRRTALADWSPLDRAEEAGPTVVIMTTSRVMARAPASLRPYVVPAAWILEGQD